MLTISNNRPILLRDLEIKQLLLDGYANNKLQDTMPFIRKILEQSQNSQVFKTCSPWISALLSLIAELYDQADYKNKWKYDVEILCDRLKVQI